MANPEKLAPSSQRGPLGVPRRALKSRAARITAAYAVFAGLWIYLSDGVLAALVTDSALLVRLSVYKGLAFVAVTSVLLFTLTRNAFRALERKHAALEEKHQLAQIHRAESERMSRLYAALSHVNQATARARTREELFNQVCEALVGHGGFRTAWIGVHDPATALINPVAVAGDDGGYVKALTIHADERPEGLGPSGIAFRTGRPYVCNDPFSDPATVQWREAVERSGFNSAATFPIVVNGRTLGVLNVYASEAHYFQDKEVALLVDAVEDISFGIEGLEVEHARWEAESRARTERRFSEAMIDTLPGILYLYTTEGKFLRWNHAFEAVSGHSGREIEGMHPLDFIAPDDRALVQERIGQVFTSGASFVEARFLARDGTTTPYYFTGSRVTFAGEECLVGVGIDISERHAAQAALHELNQTLELKVAERTEELQEALVRAEAADRIKSAFLATMSHELRTPLNSIIGFTGIILQGLAGPLTAEQSKQLGMVLNSSRHLLDLINDVLDLSKIEAGQLEVRTDEFDLRAVLEHVTEAVKPLAEAKGLTLDVRVAPDVAEMVSDKRRVQQVLLNLLNNGIKFTDRGGVTLTAEREDGVVHLRVKDTGIGIRSEDMDDLFLAFRQIDQGLTRKHEGTGLGLAICRRLTGLMGGEISASSRWQEGSEFCVTLPIRRTA